MVTLPVLPVENGLVHLVPLLISLGIGLLIGLERERDRTRVAGLRTFGLVAFLGTLLTIIGQKLEILVWLLPVGLFAIVTLGGVAYLSERWNLETLAKQPEQSVLLENEPGITTQAALLITFCFGVLIALQWITLVVMLAIITTMLLYFKPELHGMAQNLSRRDLLSILQFGILSFIVLPILPNHNIGPYHALNPHQIWIMVVLISGINLAGYIALRIVGQRYGAPLLGIFGGLVSSTATTLIYSRQGKNAPPAMTQLALVIILLANLVVMVRLAGLVAVMSDLELVIKSAPVFGIAFLFGLTGVIYAWRGLEKQTSLAKLEVKNPTEIKTALTFGALYAVVLVATAWLSDIAGSRGLYTIAMVSGLTDVDAITLSSIRLYDLHNLTADQVVTAISLAIIANMIFKFSLVLFIAGGKLAKQCAFGMVIVALGVLLGLVVN